MVRVQVLMGSADTVSVWGLERAVWGSGFRGGVGLRAHPDSGPLRAVHLSCHKWPGGLVN